MVPQWSPMALNKIPPPIGSSNGPQQDSATSIGYDFDNRWSPNGPQQDSATYWLLLAFHGPSMVPHGPETIEKLYEVGKRKADDDDAAWNEWGDWRGTSASSGTPLTPPPPPQRATLQPRPPDGQPPFRDEEWSSEVPFDSRTWRAILDYHGVDYEAQQALFLLCQHSSEGARAGKSLLARFVKDDSKQQAIANPSAFIMSGAMRARHQVEDLYGQGKESWQL